MGTIPIYFPTEHLALRSIPPPHRQKVSITDDDKGPIVNVVGWLCIVTTVLSVLTRLLLRLTTSKGVHKDDVAVLFGMIFAIGHTAAITSQVAHGLGRRQAVLGPRDLDLYQQAGFASQLLFIVGCAASKISTAILFYAITPAKTWRMVIAYFGYSVAGWSVITMFCIGFQCALPQSWAILNVHGQCFNQTAFWSFSIVIDILQELFLIIVPILFVKGLHMTLTHKIVVIFAFSFRILVVIFSCVRLYFIVSLPATDTTFAAVNVVIFTQLTLCISLVVSCVPFLKSVMENLQSGLITNHGQHGLFAAGATGSNRSGSYALKHMSKSFKTTEADTQLSNISQVKRVKPMLADDDQVELTRERLQIEVVNCVEVTTLDDRTDDGESLNSLSGSERRILGRGNRAMVQGGAELRG